MGRHGKKGGEKDWDIKKKKWKANRVTVLRGRLCKELGPVKRGGGGWPHWQGGGGEPAQNWAFVSPEGVEEAGGALKRLRGHQGQNFVKKKGKRKKRQGVRGPGRERKHADRDQKMPNPK